MAFTDTTLNKEINKAIELTVVMPCLNEAETLATCIDKAMSYLARSGVVGEVVVADNGSTDGSQAIAEAHGARVVNVPVQGYGAALQGGIAAARGRYVIMGDADDSYDFSMLQAFVERLREGYELVMGNRFKGDIAPGAMPSLHKYLGNPVLSGIGRLFFGSPIGDFHCGLRGFNKQAIQALNLRTTGMEFASEMVVKATLRGLKITEVPTTLSPDGRSRPPHLRSWRDGWRHLRFLLMYSPRWLFLYPGLTLLLLGLLAMLALLPGPLTIRHVTFDVHTLLIAALLQILGIQALSFGMLAKQFGINEGLLPADSTFEQLRRFVSLERLLIAGAVLSGFGLIGVVTGTSWWAMHSFGELNYSSMMRLVIPSVTAIALGFQLILVGFLSSIIDLKLGKN